MAILRKKRVSRRKKVGLSPGSLIYTGSNQGGPVRIHVFDYTHDSLNERVVEKLEDCFPYRDSASVTWINVDGLSDVDTLRKLGEHFGIHPLVLEDILNVGHRPKIDDLDDYLFLVLKMLHGQDNSGQFYIEQLSIILGKNFVISFQEANGDVFGQVRERLRTGKGRLRLQGADYLAYVLFDAITDHYYTFLENLEDKIEKLDNEIVKTPEHSVLEDIHTLKRDVVAVRRVVNPLREVANSLKRSESELLKQSTGIFFDDLSDHLVYLSESLDSYRDLLSGMEDFYLTVVNNRLNETVKMLTVMASIFIPLTFISSIYGMNFEHMPELRWEYGYPFAIAVMIGTTLLIIGILKRKNWI
jgi:magnesium transporter